MCIFLPSVSALQLWLDKIGFAQVRCVDINITTNDEQRTTEWMTYHSLDDFFGYQRSFKKLPRDILDLSVR